MAYQRSRFRNVCKKYKTTIPPKNFQEKTILNLQLSQIHHTCMPWEFHVSGIHIIHIILYSYYTYASSQALISYIANKSVVGTKVIKC